MIKPAANVNDIVRRGVIEIIPEQEFIDALRSGRKLRLKLGLDPSKPDLHIGHAVLLRKLRLLQEMGHQVVLIVGDWTAQIGDPSGQSVQRPMLSAEEVKANAETYMRQFFHVVDRERTEVRWQSEWFGAFTLADVVRLAARFTVAQMLQREDFRQRFEAHQPLGIHELLYPLLQAYDSVAIRADVEFGGSDQLFNLLVGRELQQEMGQRPQIVFTMRLLVGTDGVQKMSKSTGNTVDFEDPPGEKYGKVMSIPDSALMDYLELATDIGDEELAFIRKQLEERSVNPMEIKKRLAREIVAQFHGEAAAGEAEAEWGRAFRRIRSVLREDVPATTTRRGEIKILSVDRVATFDIDDSLVTVTDALRRFLETENYHDYRANLNGRWCEQPDTTTLQDGDTILVMSKALASHGITGASSQPAWREMSASESLGEAVRQLFEQEAPSVKILEISEDEKYISFPFRAKVGFDVPARWVRSKGPGWNLVNILVDARLVRSASEARRLIAQGAIDVNGVRVNDETLSEEHIRPGTTVRIRVGKHRFLRIVDADRESKTS